MYISMKTVLNCNNILKYYYFYYFFKHINAVNMRYIGLLKNLLNLILSDTQIPSYNTVSKPNSVNISIEPF